jgi:hypothetical protein
LSSEWIESRSGSSATMIQVLIWSGEQISTPDSTASIARSASTTRHIDQRELHRGRARRSGPPARHGKRSKPSYSACSSDEIRSIYTIHCEHATGDGVLLQSSLLTYRISPSWPGTSFIATPRKAPLLRTSRRVSHQELAHLTPESNQFRTRTAPR